MHKLYRFLILTPWSCMALCPLTDVTLLLTGSKIIMIVSLCWRLILTGREQRRLLIAMYIYNFKRWHNDYLSLWFHLSLVPFHLKYSLHHCVLSAWQTLNLTAVQRELHQNKLCVVRVDRRSGCFIVWSRLPAHGPLTSVTTAESTNGDLNWFQRS